MLRRGKEDPTWHVNSICRKPSMLLCVDSCWPASPGTQPILRPYLHACRGSPSRCSPNSQNNPSSYPDCNLCFLSAVILDIRAIATTGHLLIGVFHKLFAIHWIFEVHARSTRAIADTRATVTPHRCSVAVSRQRWPCPSWHCRCHCLTQP